ncbi:MAG TPA: TetR/AcrR family transcriptional regulator [Pelagibacterium sp.]|uniref:TetR/AcrR family transcriptional regulator n=1 Tax=Pelagibacterium sp. TaxID=1967288 RepID=UPI002C0E0720|nr:TetR/AcrR family transcriptional regulator [Pelagibacterium sp.]HWJ87277.1 TetR/AcrR family transcriptional regulator [Pelagibacterium sp.]
MKTPSSVPPPKFRRRAEARPDEVLDAALGLFMEKGFAATRVEDIAKRAGLSKGAVYLYFSSKEAILEGLVRRAILPVAQSALSTLDAYEGDPRVIIALVIRTLGARFSDPQTLAIPKVVLREVLGFPHLAEMYRREVLDRAIPALEKLVARGIEQGYLRPVDPELTVRSIVGPIMVHAVLAEVFGVMPKGGLEIDKLIDNHLTILFDGMSAPGAK